MYFDSQPQDLRRLILLARLPLRRRVGRLVAQLRHQAAHRLVDHLGRRSSSPQLCLVVGRWPGRHWKPRRLQERLPCRWIAFGEPSHCFSLSLQSANFYLPLQTFTYVPSSVNATVDFYPSHSTKAAVVNPKRISAPRIKSAARSVASVVTSAAQSVTSAAVEAVESVVAPASSTEDAVEVQAEAKKTPTPVVLAAKPAQETKPVWSKVVIPVRG